MDKDAFIHFRARQDVKDDFIDSLKQRNSIEREGLTLTDILTKTMLDHIKKWGRK